MTVAAFFDMDRTVLRIDSGMSWLRFLYMRGEVTPWFMARAGYWSTLYKLALLDLETLGQRLVADLAGDSEAEMVAKCAVWYESFVADQVAPPARRAIERHRAAGHRVALLTSSTQFVAEVVASSLEMDTLCSRLEIDRGRFTGRIAQLCFGHSKVPVAERYAGDRDVDLASSYFYSDSYNDLPMLERVGHAVAVNPDTRLRRHARRAGWVIEDWDRMR